MAALAKGNEAKKAHFKNTEFIIFVCFCDKKDYSMFQLTKADKNSIDVIDKKNNRIKTSVITQLVISLIVGLISLFLGKLIDKI